MRSIVCSLLQRTAVAGLALLCACSKQTPPASCKVEPPVLPDPMPANFDWTPLASDWCAQLAACGYSDAAACESAFLDGVAEAAALMSGAAILTPGGPPEPGMVTFTRTLTCPESEQAKADPSTCAPSCQGYDSTSPIVDTRCTVTLRITTSGPNCGSLNPMLANCTTAVFKIFGVSPNGTYHWDPTASGGSLPGAQPCSGSNFAPYYTVSPPTASGPNVSFAFTRTAATQNFQAGCVGTFLDQDGNVVKDMNGNAVEPSLLIDEY